MKKWICASSLFVLFIASFCAFCYCMTLEVDASIWWWAGGAKYLFIAGRNIWVLSWTLFNIVLPLLLLVCSLGLLGTLLSGFWELAMWACGKWDTK